VHLFKSAVVCVAVVAICGCDRSQPTPPVATNNTPVVEPSPVPPPSVEPSTPIPNPTPPSTTNNPTPVELPESADSIGMEFKMIPAGDFLMGSPQTETRRNEDEFQHRVRITKPFKMCVHEVTQAQYEQVMGNNRSMFKGAEHPVEAVNWVDAVEFCRRLSELPAEKAAGNIYRLPTEAQWEYACRAGTTTQFSFGDDEADLGDYAWYAENSANKTHPVGSKLPNAWGLYDMHGNVWEWCLDWYGDMPSGSLTDPTGPTSGRSRVRRGGSWSHDAGDCRSALRVNYGPAIRRGNIGFRVSLSPSSK